MNKMRRTVALFIAMLMLFSCVQGGVFTAMAVLVQGGVVRDEAGQPATGESWLQSGSSSKAGNKVAPAPCNFIKLRRSHALRGISRDAAGKKIIRFLYPLCSIINKKVFPYFFPYEHNKR